jgi:2-polyprenyl-3-methyl-5-hydroxy-6-metoxy-1,4-benzoquinol methylase
MIPERFIVLKPWIEGKKVLHIGCVQHRYQEWVKESWIHGFITDNASETIGIDIIEDGIKELSRQGYNVQTANAEDFNLNTDFDVIFAGELIEHLDNIGGFLDSCKKHMKDESQLIISTPNSFGIIYYITRFFGIRFINPEHVCWFDEQTLEQVLKRHGLKPEEKKFLRLYSSKLKRLWNFIFFAIETVVPNKFRGTLFFVSRLG